METKSHISLFPGALHKVLLSGKPQLQEYLLESSARELDVVHRQGKLLLSRGLFLTKFLFLTHGVGLRV